MKLRQWLKETHQLSYAQYKALPEMDQWELWGEHQQFCQRQQRLVHRDPGWRPMTPEEAEKYGEVAERERGRYKISKSIGGIDGKGNYTALHHRWEEGLHR